MDDADIELQIVEIAVACGMTPGQVSQLSKGKSSNRG